MSSLTDFTPATQGSLVDAVTVHNNWVTARATLSDAQNTHGFTVATLANGVSAEQSFRAQLAQAQAAAVAAIQAELGDPENGTSPLSEATQALIADAIVIRERLNTQINTNQTNRDALAGLAAAVAEAETALFNAASNLDGGRAAAKSAIDSDMNETRTLDGT